MNVGARVGVRSYLTDEVTDTQTGGYLTHITQLPSGRVSLRTKTSHLLRHCSFFKSINLSIYLFMAVLGLRCCAQPSSSCSEQGLLFVAVCGLLIAWLLLLRSTGSRCVGFSSCGSQALERRLSSCGAQASLLRSMWDLPGPGLEPVSPALAGRFLTTVPPGKSFIVAL